MARTDLTAQTPARTGAATTFTPAIADGHAFANNGRRILRIKNTDATQKTVTVLSPPLGDGRGVDPTLIVVPATTGDVLTPCWPASYNQSTGKVHVDYSAVTGLSIAVIDVPTA
ncbi:hypothetical protein OG948_21275 [Embleya sp. NBC_00888]|uniref:hypothetical protein n=1 Tax=Embleya sp. NBC_00888 TaxID=2975960 RepID=UPI0038666880|nr:hypothetical protein OG948_21275 [Embleya sp. NBC_00888]